MKRKLLVAVLLAVIAVGSLYLYSLSLQNEVAGGQKVVATGTAFNVDLLGPDVLVTLIEGRVVVLPQTPISAQRKTPEILDAWPTVAGLICINFCRASFRKLGTVP